MSGARLEVHSEKPGLEVVLDGNRAIKGCLMDNNSVFYRIKNGHINSTIVLSLDAILTMNAIMQQLVEVKVPVYEFTFDFNTGSFFKNHKIMSHFNVLDELNKSTQTIAPNIAVRPKPTLTSWWGRVTELFVTLLQKQNTISDLNVQQKAPKD